MPVVIVTLDVLAHTLGLLNLFLLVLLYARDRDSLYLRELLLMGSFSLIVIHQSLQAALGSDLPPWLGQAGGTLAMCGVSLMIFALPWYIQHLENGPWPEVRHLDSRLFLGAAILALGANLGTEIGRHAGWPGWAGANSIMANVTLGLCVAAIAWTLFLAIQAAWINWRLARGRIGSAGPGGSIPMGSSPSTRPSRPTAAQTLNDTTRMAIRMGLLTLILMPVLLWLDFAGQSLPGLDRFKVLPVEYLLWSALLMNLRVRTILASPTSGACPDHDAVGLFCRSCDISPREQEVLEALVCGRTYEQIADSLCISLSTVKTHVGKIYRKAGVANKVELIHRMQTGHPDNPGEPPR